MKFGETLFQRSTPEWAINNIDYNDLKHLIKVQTSTKSGSRSQPIVIKNDGSSPQDVQQFEDEFCAELVRQHDRVNDFVKVKHGELGRRLAALDAQVSRFSQDRRPSSAHGNFSNRHAQKLARLEANVSRTRQDIHALSRFASANTIAFTKILKKYRKWTGSQALEDRFLSKTLNHSSGLGMRNFDVLFTTYNALLESLHKIPKTVTKGDDGNVSQEPSIAGQQEATTKLTGTAFKNHHVNSQARLSNGVPVSKADPEQRHAHDSAHHSFHSRMSKKRRRRPQKTPQALPQYQQRYWNEFDDGSEGEQTDTYAIFIDPNASSGIPGTAVIATFITATLAILKSPFNLLESKIGPWNSSFSRQRLLDDGEQQQSSPDDSDLSEDDEIINKASRTQRSHFRHYSTFPASARRPRPDAASSREDILFRTCLLAFAASAILLVIASILLKTGRKKQSSRVDVGVVLGVTAALVFAIIGIGSMISRSTNVGWLHRSVVLLAAFCIAMASAALLVTMAS